MTEPTVSYPLRDVLRRIESSVDELRKEMHAVQVSLAASSATDVADAAKDAAGRARLAMWAASAAALLGPLSAVLIAVLGH